MSDHAYSAAELTEPRAIRPPTDPAKAADVAFDYDVDIGDNVPLRLSYYAVRVEPRIPSKWLRFHSRNLVRRKTARWTVDAYPQGSLALAAIVATEAPTLAESLALLDRVGELALEEGLDAPHEVASSTARKLLSDMHRVLPGLYDVCPEEGGGVTLSAPSARGTAFTVECDASGAVECVVVLPARMRKATYSDAQDLPDGFIREALEAVSPLAR